MSPLPFTHTFKNDRGRTMIADMEFDMDVVVRLVRGDLDLTVVRVFANGDRMYDWLDSLDPAYRRLGNIAAEAAQKNESFIEAAMAAEGIELHNGRYRYLPDPDRQREDRVADELMDAAE